MLHNSYSTHRGKTDKLEEPVNRELMSQEVEISYKFVIVSLKDQNQRDYSFFFHAIVAHEMELESPFCTGF